jgi:bifunctional DNA-binding transcriptional regulator/antitoxin component of YhaV-PrlF toxin-antitoxin module
MTPKLIEMAANGRLVIPRDTRNALGLHDSEQFTVEIRDGSIVLTPVAVVPLDRTFPITPELVSAANRAAAEAGAGLSRSELRERLTRPRG